MATIRFIRDRSQAAACVLLLAGVRIANFLDDLYRLFWTQRQIAEHLQRECVSLDVLLSFQVELPGQALGVDDGGRLAGEFKDGEVALKCRMRPNRIGDHLNRDIWLFRDLDNVIQLPAHYAVAAQRPTEYCLVEHYLDRWRIFSGQDLLSFMSFLDAFFNRRFIKPWYSGVMDRANVISNLE